MIDEHRALAHAVERAVGAERDLAHVVVVADAHHHEVLTGRGLLRRRGLLAAELRDPLVGLGGVAVVDGDLVAALGLEMPGHRIAHHAEAQKRHFRHRSCQCPVRFGPINILRGAPLTIAPASLWWPPNFARDKPMPVTKDDVLAALGKVAAPDGTPLPQTGTLSDIVAERRQGVLLDQRGCRRGAGLGAGAKARRGGREGDPRRAVGDGCADRRAEGRRGGRCASGASRCGRRCPSAARAHGRAGAGPVGRAGRDRRSSRLPPARAASANRPPRSTLRSGFAISA